MAGGALALLENSAMTMDDGAKLIFDHNFVDYDGGAIFISDYARAIIHDILYVFNHAGMDGGDIYASGGSCFYERKSNHTQGSASRGGAIGTYEQGQVYIEDAIFDKCSATNNGGTIYCGHFSNGLDGRPGRPGASRGDYCPSSLSERPVGVVKLINSVISNSYCNKTGGALHSDRILPVFSNVTIHSPYASIGGVLAVSSEDVDCLAAEGYVDIYNASAMHASALWWPSPFVSYDCSNLISAAVSWCHDCYSSSSAGTVGLPAYRLAVVTDPSGHTLQPDGISLHLTVSPGLSYSFNVCAYDIRFQLDTTMSHGQYCTAIIDDCPDCLLGGSYVIFGLSYDSANSSVFDVYATNNDIRRNPNDTASFDGCASFTDTSVRVLKDRYDYDHDMTMTMTFQSPVYRNEYYDTLVSNYVILSFNLCPPGYGVAVDGTEMYLLCVTCQVGTYSFSNNSGTPCIGTNCGPKMECPGRDQTRASAGYWVYHDHTSGVASPYPCPSGVCMDNSTCAPHRHGLLCGTCDDGYSPWADLCMKCDDDYDWLLIGILLAASWTYTIITIFLAQSEAGYFGLLAYFTQTVTLILAPSSLYAFGMSNGFNFKFERIFVLPRSLGGSSSDDLCPFKRDGTGVFTMNLLAPLASFGFLLITLVLHAVGTRISNILKRQNSTIDRRKFGVMYARGLFMLISSSYQVIVVWSANYLDCRPAGDKFVMWATPDVECGSDAYSSLIYLFIPFCLYSFALPLGLLLLIRRVMVQDSDKKLVPLLNSDDAVELETTPVKTDVMLMLTGPYRAQYYYWECMQMMRRFIFVMVYVLLSRGGNPTVVPLGCMFVETVFLIVQLYTNPMKTKLANQLEALVHFSLVVISVGVASGAYIFSTESEVSSVYDDIVFTAVHTFSAMIFFFYLAVVAIDAMKSELDKRMIKRKKSMQTVVQ